MTEPYEFDVAPNGKVFVSQCGWGRRFDDLDAALGYVLSMGVDMTREALVESLV